MTVMPLAEVRTNLSQIVDEAVATHLRVEITRKGRRAAILLSAEDYDSLIETLEVASDAELVADIHQAISDMRRGEVYTLEEVKAEMRERGRLS